MYNSISVRYLFLIISLTFLYCAWRKMERQHGNRRGRDTGAKTQGSVESNRRNGRKQKVSFRYDVSNEHPSIWRWQWWLLMLCWYKSCPPFWLLHLDGSWNRPSVPSEFDKNSGHFGRGTRVRPSRGNPKVSFQSEFSSPGKHSMAVYSPCMGGCDKKNYKFDMRCFQL